ncbi:hypothetical protein FGO68_gene6588 [Halteria grandinella]|uniref:CUB domain-containing protein n=1 Tax=Halteria grandinella TaxID=5974 RepID=A0A8J8NRM2_HALGN|nr:hypothetical protein FGO68_gene6588 [Halteria grandinella]
MRLRNFIDPIISALLLFSLLLGFTSSLITTQKDCKICIDQKKVYCSSDIKLTGGTCYSDVKTANASRTTSSSQLCTSDVTLNQTVTSNRFWQLWACPNEYYCASGATSGSSYPSDFILSADVNQTVKYLLHDSSVSNLLDGSFCRYLIQFPSIGGPNDTLVINAHLLERVNASIALSQTYTSNGTNASEVKEFWLNETNQIEVKYPSQVFLTILGSSWFRGDFNISYRFVNNPGPDGSQTPVKESDSSSDDSSQVSSSTVLIIVILGSIIILILICSLIAVGCVIRRRRQERIVNLSDNKTITQVEGPQSKAFFASVEDNQKLDEIMEEYLKRRFGPDFKMPQQLNTSNSLLGPSPSLPTQEFSREDYVTSSQLNKTALNDNSSASIHQQAASFEGDKIKSKSQFTSQPIDKQLNNHSSVSTLLTQTDQSAVIPLAQSNGGGRQDMLSTLPTLQQRATNTLPPLVVATRHRQQFIVENEIDELVLDDEVNEESMNKGKKKRQTTLHRII